MVALKGQAIVRFLERPDPDCTAILVYGPDRGLVAERARALLAGFADNPDDPFTVSILDEADIARGPERLAEELNALPFGAGRRTIVVRGSGAAPPATIAEALAGPRSAVLIVESGDLKPSSPVRKAFEAAKDAAALPCYADDGGTLGQLVRAALGAMDQTITTEAREVLLSRLGADRLASRGEIDKLTLYAGRGARISVEDVDAATADAGELTLDALVDAVGEGDPKAAELAFERATEAGMAPAQILSAAIRHFIRLHELAGARDGPPDAVVSAARPPIHFRRKESVVRQLRRWSEPELRRGLELLAGAEVDGRVGPVPVAATSRALLRLALLPRAARRR
jgi:DNA polymerase-3 subunit delta